MPRNEEVSLSSLGIQMPYNMQAEQSILGAALMDETILNQPHHRDAARDVLLRPEPRGL